MPGADDVIAIGVDGFDGIGLAKIASDADIGLTRRLQRIVTFTTEGGVIAIALVLDKGVIACSALERVIAAAANYGVVTRGTGDAVIAALTANLPDIVEIGLAEIQCLALPGADDVIAIGVDGFDGIGLAKIASDADIGLTRRLQRIVTFTTEGGVIAIALVLDKGVIACSALERVIASATYNRVITITTLYRIIPAQCIINLVSTIIRICIGQIDLVTGIGKQ